MIRVLRVIARMNVGGPAIHATLLASGLDPSRYETTLVTGAEGENEGNHLALHRQAIPNLITIPDLGREIRGVQDLRSLASLLGVVRRFRPHIVHTHAAKAGTIGRVAARLAGVPVVVHTFHGHVLRGYFSPRKEQVFRVIERGLARITDELVAVSPRVRQELLDMRIGRPDAFSVVPLGFDLARFTHAETHRGELRAELGVPPGSPMVGIVARLVPIKAHEVFVAAARHLHAQRPDAHFVIVGDGERRAELAQLVSAGGEAFCAAVHFLGWRADLARIYADLDVVTLTSRNEGSPVALIEAMAAGRPVVATRVGGVPDVVEHGRRGLLVEMDDALGLAEQVLQVLASPEDGASMGREGRRHALGTYGSARLIDDIDRLYGRLLVSKEAA
jgi:glycosyltransferase involved in cell wall biosynthesis